MKRLYLFILAFGLLSGCSKQDDSHITQLQDQATQLNVLTSNQNVEISNLSNQEQIMVTNISILENNLSNDNAVIFYEWNEQQTLKTNVSILTSDYYEFRNLYSSAPVNPQNKGYGFLNTPFGNLLLSTESVNPYLDGFKIHFSIGNPTSARFNGFSLICSTFESTNFLGTLRYFTNDFTDSLPPGRWTPIDFVLAPANMDEIRNASVSIQLNQLSLLPPPASSQ